MKAGTRGLVGALVVAVTPVIGVPVAGAGTYQVVSCGAPGAGGTNAAWRAEAGGYDSPDGTIHVPADPSSYVIADQCPGQLFISSAPPDGTTAPFLTSGNWVFDAPAGTSITRLETWRFGVRLRTAANDSDPNTNGDQGDPWRVFARDQGASLIGGVFGENCTAPPGAIGCSFGSDTGMSAAARAVYDFNATRIAYSVSCETPPNCPRTFQDTPVATIKVFGTRVTVTDNTRPTFTIGGPLLNSGWRRPRQLAGYDASDNTGIRTARLDIAGHTTREIRSCDYRRTVPCSNVSAGRLAVPAGVPDGQHIARFAVTDTAGNENAISRQIFLDGTPPGAVLERASGKTIVISVTDNASGVASATLETRRSSNEPYQAANATLAGGRLTAKLASGSASRTDMRVTVRDKAGNVTQGNPTKLTATSAKIGKRSRRIRSGRIKVPFGRTATLRGRLALSAGQGFAGQTVVASSTVRRRGAHAQSAGSAFTDRRGRFSIKVPAGPSRSYRLVFPGAGGALGSARSVSVRVPASSTIKASRRHFSGAGRVLFSGRLRSRGQRVPGRGLLLILQGREGRKWRTFEDVRTTRKGRWRVSYRFTGRPGRYPIRVRIRQQSGYPFELGYSRRLTIRVG